ncbi:hypothetical protein TNCV_1533231 [Trichonephila clavipes]|nr:hypothetical protein TNCV_1533231 [Trichonephila clavipes]
MLGLVVPRWARKCVSVAGLVRWNADCLFPKFATVGSIHRIVQMKVCFVCPEDKFKAILDQLPNEQETAVRTDVESRNHVEAIPAQVEACVEACNGGGFA